MYHNSAIDKLCMAFSGCSASFLLVQEALETLVDQFVMDISLYRHLCFVDKLSTDLLNLYFTANMYIAVMLTILQGFTIPSTQS